MDGDTLDEDVVKGVTNYFAIIMILFIIGVLIISLDPKITDLETVITSVAACLNNIGPGLSSMIGPLGSFADFSIVSKITLIFAMLLGRLELYPILLVFNPKVWLGK
jgi:trk system potassium uptake protein TrkH